jgi:PRTRC genetic system protein C
MADLKPEVLLREFYYNGFRILDSGANLTVDQVRDWISSITHRAVSMFSANR